MSNRTQPSWHDVFVACVGIALDAALFALGMSFLFPIDFWHAAVLYLLFRHVIWAVKGRYL